MSHRDFFVALLYLKSFTFFKFKNFSKSIFTLNKFSKIQKKFLAKLIFIFIINFFISKIFSLTNSHKKITKKEAPEVPLKNFITFLRTFGQPTILPCKFRTDLQLVLVGSFPNIQVHRKVSLHWHP